ncbi:MAG: zf-HC2 domain-containing protein [Steroidobacteraceae bacterium]|nr:zf-HC2 domain-containing protein [Steroidobacteraceae bacterium]
MNLDQLTSLLAAGAADDPRRSPSCPDEHQIAGYVDGRLDEAAREQVELHLADCGHCLTLVGELCRERNADAIEPVPDAVVAQARALVAKGLQRRWRLAPQWAVAAALVLAVPLLLQLGRNLDRGAEGQGRPDAPATRTLASTATGLQVLSPGPGTAVDARQLSFRWTEVSGTPYYDVRIVTDAGDVVIRQRVFGTTWQPPAQLNLQPGAEYFVHIDAYPSGDKALSSDHVPFRVSD